MPSSQSSFETRYGRFSSGTGLIQDITTYNPAKEIIKKANLTSFLAEAAVKDAKVNSTNTFYREKVKERRINGFRDKDNLSNCLENRIRNIYSYVGAEFGHDSITYKKIKSFLDKIAPKYDKKDPGAPAGQGKSPSEQSFVALIGFGRRVGELIDDLGVAYNPGNTDITLVALGELCDMMETLTKDIAKAEIEWSKAVKARKEIYDGKDGMTDRIKAIKDYLASFDLGKKSPDYINFCRILAGR